MARKRLDQIARLLAAYDDQLRGDAETQSAVTVAARRPLRRVPFTNGRGLVTYQNLHGVDEHTIRQLVPDVLAYFRADPEITRVDWKTPGHDVAPVIRDKKCRLPMRFGQFANFGQPR